MSSDEYDFCEEYQRADVMNRTSATSKRAIPLAQVYPPLGQVTPVENGTVKFVAVLEVPQSQISDAWEVSLWHSLDTGNWQAAQMEPCEQSQKPQCLQSQDDSYVKIYFIVTLNFHTSIQYTLRYRHDPSSEWVWIWNRQGANDGNVLLKSHTLNPIEFEDLFLGIDRDWSIKSRMSQSPNTHLWSLESSVPHSKDDRPGSSNLRLGVPHGDILRTFALVQQSPSWLAPRHGHKHLHLDKDAILYVFLRSDARCVAILALGGINHVQSKFQSGTDRAIYVQSHNDGLTEDHCTILVSEGMDFDNVVAAVMYHARELQWRSDSGPERTSTLSDISPQWRESWYDGLGYCTWNSLGPDLTESKLLDALQQLAENNIRISSLIIDDNWQSIDKDKPETFDRGWLDFEADPQSFPGGLQGTVSKIREQYQQIQHVAVWHAMLGYWGGISPKGKLAQIYHTIEVQREVDESGTSSIEGQMTVISADDVQQFYQDFYSFLSSSGVDSVKTDAQFMLNTWLDASARRELIPAYFDAWALASLRNFSFQAISCMSQFSQALFYSQMPRNRPSFLVRTSDDFFPDVEDSHTWHVWANAYNSILMQHLNVVPDWDMFQTVHDYAAFHAAARCVSGGPIYISDEPGKYDTDLIKQITGQNPRGKTVIFRPSVVGKAIQPFVGYEDNILLKVGSYHGASETGTSILAVFNVSKQPLIELIPLSSFPGAIKSLEYVVRSHDSGMISQAIKIDSKIGLVTATVGIGSFDIFCAYPLTSILTANHGSVQVSTMGLLGKMTGCAAITSNNTSLQTNGRVLIDTSLKALGVLGLYISCLSDMTIAGDFMIEIQGQPIPVETVSVSSQNSSVLEIDVEQAWNKMGLKSGWSNEVQVKTYFSS